jgi:hypothetical protein
MSYLFTKLKENCKYFIFYYTLAVLAYSIILFNNIPYRDDYYRLLNPDFAWSHDGRLLANVIYKVTAVSPSILYLGALPQFIGLLFYSFLALLITDKFSKVSYKTMFLASPIVLFPYVNFTLVYKYDSMNFPLALLLASLPFLLPFKNNRHQALISFILLFLTFNIYQQGIHAYIILALFSYITGLIKNDPIKKATATLLQQGAALLAAALTYLVFLKIAVGTGHVHFNAWISQRKEIADNIKTFYFNIYEYLRANYAQWKLQPIGILMLTAIGAFTGKLFLTIVKAKNLKHKGSTIALTASAVVLLLLAPGTLLLLSKSFMFIFRYFYAFGLLFTLIILFLLPDGEKKLSSKILKYFLFYLCFAFLSHTFYSTARMLDVKEKEETYFSLLNHDLIMLTEGYSLQYYSFLTAEPLFTYDNYAYTGGGGRLHFYFNRYSPLTRNADTTYANRALIKENHLYRIYLAGTTALIEFKNFRKPEHEKL